MPGADPVALHTESEVGLQSEGLSPDGRVGGVPTAVDQRPVRRRPAVVEGRLADEIHLDRPLQAADGPHEEVLGVVVGRRPGVRRHRVLLSRGAIVSASRTRTQPDGVFHVVESTFEPGS